MTSSCNDTKHWNALETHLVQEIPKLKMKYTLSTPTTGHTPEKHYSTCPPRRIRCKNVICPDFVHHNLLAKPQITFKHHVKHPVKKYSQPHIANTIRTDSHSYNQPCSTRDWVHLQLPPTTTHHHNSNQPIHSASTSFSVLILHVLSEHHYLHGCNAYTEQRKLVQLLQSKGNVVMRRRYYQTVTAQLRFKAVSTLSLLSTLLPLWNPPNRKKKFHLKMLFLSQRIHFLQVSNIYSLPFASKVFHIVLSWSNILMNSLMTSINFLSIKEYAYLLHLTPYTNYTFEVPQYKISTWSSPTPN